MRTALQAIALKGQYEVVVASSSQGGSDAGTAVVDALKTLAASTSSSSSSNGTVALIAAQVLFAAAQVKEALQCLHTSSGSGSSSIGAATLLEQALLQLQIYLKMDRLDLATSLWNQQMRAKDEDSVLTQLGAVYLHLASGRSTAADAVHTLTMLSEQYGASPYLLNLVACALMQQGDYAGARMKLQECVTEFGGASASSSSVDGDTTVATSVPPETYANLLTCAIHLEHSSSSSSTSTDPTSSSSWQMALQQLQQVAPNHALAVGYTRVAAAFDREAIKYKV